MNDTGEAQSEERTRLAELATSVRRKIKRDIARNKKLIKNLNSDLENHGDPALWKRYGDLILANLADAVRIDDRVLVVDYFDENVPTLEIEIDENDSLTEAAEKFFRRYTKARNAKEEVSKRLALLATEISNLKSKSEE